MFGAQSTHEPSTFRVHVIRQQGMSYEGIDSSFGFSFPLCGLGEVKEEYHVMQCIGKQVIYFFKYYGSPAISIVMENLWSTSSVSCMEEPDYTGTYHLLIFIPNFPIKEVGYIYICMMTTF